MLISIVSAAIILGLLIIVHEAGHFLVAKRLGVRVIRFSIGYPPKIWGIRRGETDYAIGGTPFGGYVRMLGDEVGEEPKPEEIETYVHEIGLDLIQSARERGFQRAGTTLETGLGEVAEQLAAGLDSGRSGASAAAVAGKLNPEPAAVGIDLKPEEALLVTQIGRSGSVQGAIKALAANPPAALVASFCKRAFPTQSLWKRVLIVLAGPLANVIFAPILLALVFMYGVPVLLPIIGEARQGLPASQAGVISGDRILSINGEPTKSWGDFAQGVRASGGKPIRLEIERSAGGKAERRWIEIQPTREDQKTVYGSTVEAWIIGVMPRGDETTRREGPARAVSDAVVSSAKMLSELAVGMAAIVSGATPVREALGGPIMIAQMAGREAHRGFASVAMFTVMLSLELGLINLLPVPLLDGGHLLFFVVEGVRGKPLELRYREMALQVGLFLLVALMAFVIFNDISRIVQG